MLKTKSVSAVAIELADGVEAVFVPEGHAWHERSNSAGAVGAPLE